MLCAGAGIYVNYAFSSHVSSSTGLQGAQPSNSFAMVVGHRETLHRRFIMRCLSNSINIHTTLIFPTGETDSEAEVGSFSSNISIRRLTSGIILRYRHDYGQVLDLGDYEGVHTCVIPDSEGNILYKHIGIYNQGFSSEY